MLYTFVFVFAVRGMEKHYRNKVIITIGLDQC